MLSLTDLRELSGGDQLLEQRFRTELLALVLAMKLRRELPNQLALKGGGWVRFVYGGGRFSKDLDYQCAAPDAPRMLNGIRRAIQKAREYLGFIISTESKTIKKSPKGLTVKLSATCTDGMILHTKIEISDRGHAGRWSICTSQLHESVSEQYGIPRGTLDHLPPNLAFAEKVLALADSSRMKARDVLDIALLSRAGLELDPRTFSEVVCQRGKTTNEVLSAARLNLESPQMRLNFCEELVPTLLPGGRADECLFVDSLSAVEDFIANLEEHLAA